MHDKTFYSMQTAVPVGHIACIVTHLEMSKRPERTDTELPEGITLRRIINPAPEEYKKLYRKIGGDWLWCSRLMISEKELEEILTSHGTEVFSVQSNNEDVGMFELDFNTPGQCELSFFGIDSSLTGKGLGKALMSAVMDRVWARPVERFWVHTCTFDHPAALRFYQRVGFRAYATEIEIVADPRLTGHLPTEFAQHVPLIV